MKIAKFNSHTSEVESKIFFSSDVAGSIEYYCLVDDSYDFDATGSVNVTSLDLFVSFFENELIDYKNFRKCLMYYAAGVGFDNLSEEHKALVCRNFAVGKTERDSMFSLDEQIKYGVVFHQQSTKCRENRVAKVEAQLYNRLSATDAASIIYDVVSNNLKYNYVNFGIEGVISGDVTGLFDYFNSTVGTPFEVAGLKSRPITPLEMTVAELADHCLAILQGNV